MGEIPAKWQPCWVSRPKVLKQPVTLMDQPFATPFPPLGLQAVIDSSNNLTLYM